MSQFNLTVSRICEKGSRRFLQTTSNHLKPPQATSNHLNTTSNHLKLAALLLKRAEFQESNPRAYLWKFWRGEGFDEEK